ncbi:MAG: 50S ribosomal protein L4 [Nitrospirae bacterium]|nr:50S ribosomal protein L4 [Nitrospirota bacterium]
MLEAEIKDKSNNVVEKVGLPEGVFGLEVRQDILHTAVLNYLANQRQGTHATKTRGLVRGGGRKPWKQKHTGRARHGSIRSPLWRGGGTIFGPLPRDYSYKLNKKVKRLALKTALSSKYSDGELSIVNEIEMPKPRTKDVIALMAALQLNGKKVLIVLPDSDSSNNVVLSSRNIPGITVARPSDINTYYVLAHDHVLMTKNALETIRGLEE